MRDPADDLAELDALLGELKSGDGVPDAEAKRARCHALLAGLAGAVDPTRLVEEVKVLEALDELSDVARAAYNVLVNFPHWATECRLADAIKVADELGIEVEPYRRLALEMTRANMRDSISEILVAIRHGECPPSEDWHWIEYESTMERMRDHGVDVSRLEAALERARYIESCWARGVAPDTEDEDEEDEEVSDDVIVDSPVVRGDQTEERAPPESSSRPRDREGGGAAGRALVEIHNRSGTIRPVRRLGSGTGTADSSASV